MTTITKRVKIMKEINVQQLIDTNYRLLTLLGMGTHIIMHDAQKKDRDWWMQAIQAVVYENKPLPPMPNE